MIGTDLIMIVGVIGIGVFALYHAFTLSGRVHRIHTLCQAIVQSSMDAAVRDAKRTLLWWGSICVAAGIALAALMNTGMIDSKAAALIGLTVAVVSVFILRIFENGNFKEYAQRIYNNNSISL